MNSGDDSRPVEPPAVYIRAMCSQVDYLQVFRLDQLLYTTAGAGRGEWEEADGRLERGWWWKERSLPTVDRQPRVFHCPVLFKISQVLTLFQDGIVGNALSSV